MRSLTCFMGASRRRLPNELTLTRRSFAVLGTAMLGCKYAGAEQLETSPAPTAAALRADGDLVQRAYEALHPGL